MKSLKSYKVCFIGRTGNGKTSLINRLFGTKFSTDPLISCTKELYSVSFMLPEGKTYEAVTVYDTPGIGEFSSDAHYMRFYEDAVCNADCIVLVTTFDRTDAPVQRFLKKLRECINPNKEVRFIVALNHIDSKIITDSAGEYEPWDNEKNQPSEECLRNIDERIGIVHTKFDGKLLPFDVIPVCAARNYNIDKLKLEIISGH